MRSNSETLAASLDSLARRYGHLEIVIGMMGGRIL